MLPLQLIDLLAVLLLALVVPLLPPSQVLLDLLVFIDLGVEEDRDLPEHLIPLNRLDILGVDPQHYITDMRTGISYTHVVGSYPH